VTFVVNGSRICQHTRWGKIKGKADAISFIHFVFHQKTGKLARCLYLNQIKIAVFKGFLNL
jgi:hypothetical protein